MSDFPQKNYKRPINSLADSLIDWYFYLSKNIAVIGGTGTIEFTTPAIPKQKILLFQNASIRGIPSGGQGVTTLRIGMKHFDKTAGDIHKLNEISFTAPLVANLAQIMFYNNSMWMPESWHVVLSASFDNIAAVNTIQCQVSGVLIPRSNFPLST